VTGLLVSAHDMGAGSCEGAFWPGAVVVLALAGVDVRRARVDVVSLPRLAVGFGRAAPVGTVGGACGGLGATGADREHVGGRDVRVAVAAAPVEVVDQLEVQALALADSDLDRTRGAVLARRGKGGNRREVGIDRWAWEQLDPWLKTRAALPVGAPFCVLRGPTRGRPAPPPGSAR
jgi:hypothetical protein